MTHPPRGSVTGATLRANPPGGLLNYESASIKDLRTNTNEMIVESFTQILLPLWVVHYKLENKVYDVLLNGQTAEIFGERPQGIVGRLFGWLAGES